MDKLDKMHKDIQPKSKLDLMHTNIPKKEVLSKIDQIHKGIKEGK